MPTVFEQDAHTLPAQRVEAAFESADTDADALSYDQDLVPLGSRVAALSVPSPAGSFTMLQVRGLEPDREYGAHVHTQPCGADPDDAGGHFQNVSDPVQPSVDPEYANPDNEIWLDLTTDAQGGAVSFSWVAWQIGDREAGSIVLHERHTSTEPGEAGDAGERLGCLDVPFGSRIQRG